MNEPGGRDDPPALRARIRDLVRAQRWDEADTALGQWPLRKASGWMSASTDPEYAQVWTQVAPRPVGAESLVVFTHLPFCAGSSVASALDACFGDHGYEIPRRHGLPAIEACLTTSDAERRRLRYVHHHHPFPIVHPHADVRRVVVLRDPAGQMLSGYRKRTENRKIVPTKGMAGQPTFADAVAYHERRRLVDLQVRELAAHHPALADRYRRHYGAIGSSRRWVPRRRPLGQLESIRFEDDLFCWAATADLTGDELLDLAREVVSSCGDAVIPTERFDFGYRVSMASLGLTVAPSPPNRGRSRAPREAVDPALVERIRQMSGLDTILHREVLDRFDRRWSTAP